MKKQILAFVVSMSFASAFAASTCTWIGTSGNWSDAANWDGGVKPTDGAGDTVILACAGAGAVISNDMGAVSLAKLTFETPNAVTLVGAPIRLTSTILTHTASVIDNDLYIDDNTALNAGEKTYGADYRPTFNGTITIADGKRMYIFGNSGANFNGAIIGTGGYIYLGPNNSAYNFDKGNYHFNGAVVIKEFLHYGYGQSMAYFYNTSNRWEKIGQRYSTAYYFYNNGSLPTESVLDFMSSGDRRSPWRGYYLYGDQTADRITCSGTCPVEDYNTYTKRQYNLIRNYTNRTITLTLRGTTDATTSCSVRKDTYGIELVYDPVGDYTQEFLGSYFDSACPITVKQGTLKFSGDTLCQETPAIYVKDGACFDLDVISTNALKELTRLELGKDASLKVAATALTPFTVKPVLTMGTGASLTLPAGAAIEVGDCFAPDGRVLASGTYTGSGAAGTQVDWIEGAGTMTVVASGDYVSWDRAVDGNWSESGKWFGGAAPAVGQAATITATGTAYTVTVGATPVAPTGLIIGNGTANQQATLRITAPMTINTSDAKPLTVGTGGKVEVAAGGVLQPVPVSSSVNSLAVRDGGLLEVAGGEMNIGYLYGRFNILGGDQQESIFKISSGTCTVSYCSWGGRVFVGPNGKFAMTGGVYYAKAYSDYYRTLELAGGTVDLSGDAQFWTSTSRTPYIGFGQFNLSGSAQFCCHKMSADAWISRIYFEPSATAPLMVNVTEHAKIDFNTGIQTDLGGTVAGNVYMRLASDQEHSFGTCGYIGVGNGYSEVRLECGKLKTRTYGTVIGGMGDTERFSAATHSEGKLIVSGGTLFVYADAASVLGNSQASGLLVGACPVYTNGSTWVGSTATGILEISGGEITNVYGFTHIGVGAAKGRVVQTGGYFGTTYDKPATIGAYTGEGEWIVSNGVSDIRGALYVGGATSNEINRSDTLYPEDVAGSKGRIEASGGTFHVWDLYVGLEAALGTGTVEIGPNGALSCLHNARFDNSTLVCKLSDARAGSFEIGGDLAISDTASLEIDAGALLNQAAGSSFTLLTYAGDRTGDFAPSNIQLKGFAKPANWRVRWVDKRLVCRNPGGTAIFVR